MLLLPASVTAREANDTRRLLTQALKAEASTAEVIVDASNLRHFDSAALAVLLDCRRTALGLGRPFVLRNLPSRLGSLARLYGIDELLPAGSAGGTGGTGAARGDAGDP